MSIRTHGLPHALEDKNEFFPCLTPSFFFFSLLYDSPAPFNLVFSLSLSTCPHLIITFLFNCLSFFSLSYECRHARVNQGYNTPERRLLFFTLCQTMLLPNIIIIYSILTIEFCFGQRGHSLLCFKAIASFQFPLHCFSSRSRYTQSLLCIIYLKWT